MLIVKQLPYLTNQSSIAQIHSTLDNCPVNMIDKINWPGFSYKPLVSFCIGYNQDKIFLRFKVVEDNVMATIKEDLGRVWTDSCVEFFLSPEGGEGYYNIEANCIGSILVGYGKNRDERENAPLESLRSVVRFPSLGFNPFTKIEGKSEWDLLLIIQAKTFFCHEINDFSGKKMKANFYKCGDEMETPHFLSWSPVHTAEPDFHQAYFFKEIYFEKK